MLRTITYSTGTSHGRQTFTICVHASATVARNIYARDIKPKLHSPRLLSIKPLGK